MPSSPRPSTGPTSTIVTRSSARFKRHHPLKCK
jgi:hypothetical protein